MVTDKQYDALLQEAKKMYASGHDDKYILFQFAEKGIDDSTIDKILLEIGSIRAHAKKQGGTKQLIYGACTVAAAMVLSILSYNAASPMRFILLGMFISGIMIFVKGALSRLGW